MRKQHMKIKVIIPNSGMDRATLNSRQKMLSKHTPPEVEISVDCISDGPKSIESVTDEVLAGPYLIQAAQKAEADGYDAIIVYCFSDVAVDALREITSIPVIGPGEISLLMAHMISNRFTVITTTQKNVARTLHRLDKDPICRLKMANVRALDLPVIQLREDKEVTIQRLRTLCRFAIEQDKSDTIILGCLGLAGYGDELKKEFSVRILDPAFLSVVWAEMLVCMSVCTI